MRPNNRALVRAFLGIFLAIIVPNVALGAGGAFTPLFPEQCKCLGQANPAGGDPISTAPDYGCILQTIQNLINAAIEVGIILCVVWIAWGGFSMVISGGSAEARSQAKTRLLNAVVGMAVILISWLLIDYVMKVIYEPTTAFEGKTFGPWNSILAGNGHDYCIVAHKPEAITTGIAGILTNPNSGTTPTGGGGAVGEAKGTCSDSNTACSVAVMKREGLNDSQAAAMSCIAVTESSGGTNKGNSGTGAEGLFQITGTNWNISSNHKPPCSVSSSRQDDACNRQTAVLMFNKSGYQPWTGKCPSSGGCGNVGYGQYWNPNAVACVQKYDPSGRI